MNPLEYLTHHRLADSTASLGAPQSLRPFPPKRGLPIPILHEGSRHGCCPPAPIYPQTADSTASSANLAATTPFKPNAKSPSLVSPA